MAKLRDQVPRLQWHARRMRREPTDAETKLWSLVRSGRLQGYKFRRQVPMAGYILDFYCISAKLAVEVDGGQHLEEEAIRYDDRRARRLAELGVRIMRFPSDVVLREPNVVLSAIYDELVNRTLPARTPSPQPSPGVPGEGARGEHPPRATGEGAGGRH